MTTAPHGKLPHHTTEGAGNAPPLLLGPSTTPWDADLAESHDPTRYTGLTGELTDRAPERR
ncbi:hypothetical protein [Streptomyces sp. NPDC029674]|uniref:hypothetical protein n=1 Tax=Streptomyces sp. NPDC029674 TaxID=3365297 RepID=UPI00384FD878